MIPIVEALAARLPFISVDTSKPEVMREALQHGAGLINDVRALRRAGALQVIAEYQCPVCIMHMQFPDGDITPVDEEIPDIVSSVSDFLHFRIAFA